jgi:hypothetical protein
MEHRTLKEVRSTSLTMPADVMAREMSRTEKLERWATLLDRHKGPLRPLRGIEFLSPDRRRVLRGDNSPLALAYSDPIFREQGLNTDQLGDGIAFFSLSQAEAHRLLCDCHYGGRMTGKELAGRVRYAARHPILFRLFNWM